MGSLLMVGDSAVWLSIPPGSGYTLFSFASVVDVALGSAVSRVGSSGSWYEPMGGDEAIVTDPFEAGLFDAIDFELVDFVDGRFVDERVVGELVCVLALATVDGLAGTYLGLEVDAVDDAPSAFGLVLGPVSVCFAVAFAVLAEVAAGRVGVSFSGGGV